MERAADLDVPHWMLALFCAALAIQIGGGWVRPAPRAAAVDLSMPPSEAAMRTLAFGDPIPLAQALALDLQAFDNQPGVSIPFAALDYDRVEAWLGRILQLDPASQYPLLMASSLYAQVFQNPEKQRQMSEFVYREFLKDRIADGRRSHM